MALRHTTLLAYVLFPSSQASHLTASRWAWHHLVQLEIQLISLIKYHFKQINQTELNQITFLFKEQATFAESSQHIVFWHRINAQIELAASTSLSVLFDCEMYHPFSLMPPSPWKWITGQEDCCVLQSPVCWLWLLWLLVCQTCSWTQTASSCPHARYLLTCCCVWHCSPTFSNCVFGCHSAKQIGKPSLFFST